jgi:hypothetical protein
MDVNATLSLIRSLVEHREGMVEAERLEALDLMSGHFAALDEWLSRGGFLPAAWNKGRVTT